MRGALIWVSVGASTWPSFKRTFELDLGVWVLLNGRQFVLVFVLVIGSDDVAVWVVLVRVAMEDVTGVAGMPDALGTVLAAYWAKGDVDMITFL